MSMPVVLAEPVTLTAGEHLAGWAAVGAARAILAATRGRPHPLVAVLRLLQRGTRPAGPGRADRARRIIETVSLRCASPHGCVPRSLAVLLLCRWHGEGVRWCLGVHSPPPSSHAWVDASGYPVGEPFNPHDFYTLILAV